MAPAQEERQQPNIFDLFAEDLYLCFYCSVRSPFDNYPSVRVGASQPLMFQLYTVNIKGSLGSDSNATGWGKKKKCEVAFEISL